MAAAGRPLVAFTAEDETRLNEILAPKKEGMAEGQSDSAENCNRACQKWEDVNGYHMTQDQEKRMNEINDQLGVLVPMDGHLISHPELRCLKGCTKNQLTEVKKDSNTIGWRKELEDQRRLRQVESSLMVMSQEANGFRPVKALSREEVDVLVKRCKRELNLAQREADMEEDPEGMELVLVPKLSQEIIDGLLEEAKFIMQPRSFVDSVSDDSSYTAEKDIHIISANEDYHVAIEEC